MAYYWFSGKEKLLSYEHELRTHENKRKLKQKKKYHMFSLNWLITFVNFIPTLWGTKFLEYILKIIDKDTSSSLFIDKFELVPDMFSNR